MLKEVLSFLKNPVYTKMDCTTKEKTKVLLKVSVLAIATSLLMGIVMNGVSLLVGFDYENHAVIEMFETLSPLLIFFVAIIVAPVLEELFFRGPLVFFKGSRYFKIVFYLSVFLFGLVHISNFPSIEGYYWLVPILIAPQVCAGMYLGFVRVKLGLVWSILLHAIHNLALIGPFILMKILDIPFE